VPTTTTAPPDTARDHALPRVFWVLFAGQLVNRVGNTVQAFLVFYLGSRGLTAGGTGLVMSALGVGSVLSQPIGGVLADRVGRRFTLVAGLLSTAACLTLLGWASRLPVLVAAAGLLGVVGDVYRPASAALVADVVAPAQRARAYGLIFWAVNLGYPIAGTAAGLLAAHGYWTLFALDAGTCALFALIVAVGVPRDARPRDAARGGYRTVLRDRLLVGLAVLTLGFATVYGQATVGIPLAMRDAGLAPSAYGVVPVVNGLLIVVLQPFATRWPARRDPLRVLAVSWLTVGVGMALTGLAATPVQYAGTAVLWTLGEIGTGGLTAALVADLAPAGAQARYQAVLGWAWGVSKLAAPAVGTGVYAALGPAALWWGCAGLGAACAAAVLALAPAARNRRAAGAFRAPGRGSAEGA
jgi:MFS family permease